MKSFSHGNHGSSEEKERIYDREVTSFLLTYILRYKKSLILALFLVLIITGSNLLIPYVFKISIDTFIVKNGYLITGMKDMETDFALSKDLSRYARLIKDDIFFLPESALRYFPQHRINSLKDEGAMLGDEFVFVENPDLSSPEILNEINKGMELGYVKKFGSDYCITTTYISQFNLEELAALRRQDIHHITLIAVVMIFVLVIQFFAAYIQTITLVSLANKALRDLRVDLFDRIQHYPMSFFDTNPIGKLVNRITNDVEVLQETFTSVLITLFQDIILLTAITIILFKEHVFLASIVALSFPLIALITIFFRIASKKAYALVRKKVSDMNTFLQESISGIRIIQFFTAEEKNLSTFTEENTALYQANIRQIIIHAFFRPLLGMLHWGAVGAVIYFAARGIIRHTISFGMLVLFLQYIQSFFRPIWDLAEKFDMIISANAAGEKILSVWKADVTSEKPLLSHSTEENPPAIDGDILIKDLSFSYIPDQPVLKNIDCKIPFGKTIAIVGETGSGKTTFISLLSRLYEITSGSISFNGHPLPSIPLAYLRSKIAVVMQEVFLFNRTIRENIILSRPFDEKKYKAAIKATGLSDFIDGFEDGDRHIVQERGLTFSQGERQLISFARALYHNPSLLILDEATSNIDSETEKHIQQAIDYLIQDRTSIIIAHRLSTIKKADIIYLFEHGEIAEQGTHRELLAKKGLYYRLYSLQFSRME